MAFQLASAFVELSTRGFDVVQTDLAGVRAGFAAALGQIREFGTAIATELNTAGDAVGQLAGRFAALGSGQVLGSAAEDLVRGSQMPTAPSPSEAEEQPRSTARGIGGAGEEDGKPPLGPAPVPRPTTWRSPAARDPTPVPPFVPVPPSPALGHVADPEEAEPVRGREHRRQGRGGARPPRPAAAARTGAFLPPDITPLARVLQTLCERRAAGSRTAAAARRAGGKGPRLVPNLRKLGTRRGAGIVQGRGSGASNPGPPPPARPAQTSRRADLSGGTRERTPPGRRGLPRAFPSAPRHPRRGGGPVGLLQMFQRVQAAARREGGGPATAEKTLDLLKEIRDLLKKDPGPAAAFSNLLP